MDEIRGWHQDPGACTRERCHGILAGAVPDWTAEPQSPLVDSIRSAAERSKEELFWLVDAPARTKMKRTCLTVYASWGDAGYLTMPFYQERLRRARILRDVIRLPERCRYQREEDAMHRKFVPEMRMVKRRAAEKVSYWELPYLPEGYSHLDDDGPPMCMRCLALRETRQCRNCRLAQRVHQ